MAVLLPTLVVLFSNPLMAAGPPVLLLDPVAIDPWWRGFTVLDDRSFDRAYPRFATAGHRIVFSNGGSFSVGGTELWSSDGTSAGTERITDFGTQQQLRPGYKIAGDYFLSDLAELNGAEEVYRLWVTDLKTGDFYPVGPARANRHRDSASGREWLAVGDEIFLKDHGLSVAPLIPNASTTPLIQGTVGSMISAGPNGLFSIGRNGHRELWLARNLPGQPRQMVEIVPELNEGDTEAPSPDNLVIAFDLGAKLLVAADWSVEGSVEGWYGIDVLSGEAAFLGNSWATTDVSILLDGDTAHFVSRIDGQYGLWRSDGTAANTELVYEAVNDTVLILGNINDHVIIADTSTTGDTDQYETGRLLSVPTDGTPVFDLLPDVAEPITFNNPFTELNGQLFGAIRAPRAEIVATRGTLASTRFLEVAGSPWDAYYAFSWQAFDREVYFHSPRGEIGFVNLFRMDIGPEDQATITQVEVPGGPWEYSGNYLTVAEHNLFFAAVPYEYSSLLPPEILFVIHATIPGDTNCDGTVDFFDIDPFVTALLDAGGYADLQPTCDRMSADTNEDGYVDYFDIDVFVQLLLGAS